MKPSVEASKTREKKRCDQVLIQVQAPGGRGREEDGYGWIWILDMEHVTSTNKGQPVLRYYEVRQAGLDVVSFFFLFSLRLPLFFFFTWGSFASFRLSRGLRSRLSFFFFSSPPNAKINPPDAGR